MFHLVSVWLTRIIVLGVLIALTVMYGIPKWFGDQASPARAPSTIATEKAGVAPAGAETSASPAAEQTAAEVSRPAVSASDATFKRCQPLGRTARGELVYSMDCRPSAE